MMARYTGLECGLNQTNFKLHGPYFFDFIGNAIEMNQDTPSEKPTREASELLRFDHEWISLQTQYEHYERSSLLIKLTCVVLFAIGLMFPMNVLLASAFILIFWLQEGIFRTFQARLGDRLLHVEGCLRGSENMGFAYQLHTEWLKNRPSVFGLILEYAKHAARPTVAFPYVVLLVLDVLVYLVW